MKLIKRQITPLLLLLRLLLTTTTTNPADTISYYPLPKCHSRSKSLSLLNMTHTVARGINTDSRLCSVAFDQPDVKERKLSFLFYFLSFFESHSTAQSGLFLICTARREMKENQRRQTHHVPCVSQVSVVGRHVARASKQEK